MSFLLLLALAQQTPVELLTQVDENYQSLKTFHIETDTFSENRSETRGGWERRQIVLVVDSPTRLRFAMNAPFGNYQIVADGKTLWRAAAHMRKYVVSELNGPAIEAKGGGMEAMNSLSHLRVAMPSFNKRIRRLKTAEFLADETLIDQGRPVLCRVIRAQYEPHAGQTLWERKFWVDESRKLVLKETFLNEGSSSPMRPFELWHNESVTTHRHVHLGELPKTYDFQFLPPANYAAVDKIEMTGMSVQTQDQVGKPAPDVLAPYKGKVLLVHFWATWCAPCREQMPALVKLYSQLKDQNVLMIGINADESADTAKDYIRRNGLDWLQWMEADHRAKFKVNAIPTLIVVDREGKMAAYEVGSGTEVEKNLRTALAKEGVKFLD
jgi:thiol-disulfide isomerase/thioredoxin